MVLGRIAHYAFDVVLLSTVVAGVRRSSGFTSVSFLPSYIFVLPRCSFPDPLTRLSSPGQMLVQYLILLCVLLPSNSSASESRFLIWCKRRLWTANILEGIQGAQDDHSKCSCLVGWIDGWNGERVGTDISSQPDLLIYRCTQYQQTQGIYPILNVQHEKDEGIYVNAFANELEPKAAIDGQRSANGIMLEDDGHQQCLSRLTDLWWW